MTSAQAFTCFNEHGRGSVLGGLTPTESGQVKRINKDAEMISVSDAASLDAAVAKLGA